MLSKEEVDQQSGDAVVGLVPGRSRGGAHESLVRFREAALRLSDVSWSQLNGAAEASEAASALMDMAAAGDEAGLREVLRSDPQRNDVIWTVACYQIGDLTPSELRDFSSAVECCKALAACVDPSHLAAELVVSTATGIRWTAAYRTGSKMTFQLPGTSSANSEWSAEGDGLAEAVDHWRDQLDRWAADPYVGLPAAADDDALGLSSDTSAAVTAPVWIALTQVLGGVEDLSRHLDEGRSEMRQLALRLGRIERLLAELLDDQPSGSPSHAVGTKTSADGSP